MVFHQERKTVDFTYRQRQPHKTVLYETIRDYLDEFVEICRIDGKPLPVYIEKQFRGYLRCGIVQFGFVRRICEHVLTQKCTHTILTPFSCKFTGFCPSCCGRRMAEAALHLVDNVLPHRAMRQWIVTLPVPLRYIAATNKDLQAKIHRIIINEIHRYYMMKSSIVGSKAGSITFTQRWGSALNLNLHYHHIVLDGVFFLNGHDELTFKNVKEPTTTEIAQVILNIKNSVIKLLRKIGVLGKDASFVDIPDDPLFDESPALGAATKASISHLVALGERAGQRVRFIGRGFGYEEDEPKFKGRHCAELSGFTLHCATRIRATDRKGLEKLLMYMARGPIAATRLTRDDEGNLRYQLKKAFTDGTTHVLLSPLELLEKIAALIAPPWQNQIHYNGVFAPAADWRSAVVSSLKKPRQTQEEESQAEEAKGSVYHRTWSELLRRVFNLNLDICPLCGGKFLTIATITDPQTIGRILTHLGIGPDPPDMPLRKVFKMEPFLDFA